MRNTPPLTKTQWIAGLYGFAWVGFLVRGIFLIWTYDPALACTAAALVVLHVVNDQEKRKSTTV